MNSTEAADHLAKVAKGELRPTALHLPLRALANFRLPNGASSPQPFLRVKLGDVISLDGDEPVTERELLDRGLVEYAR